MNCTRRCTTCCNRPLGRLPPCTHLLVTTSLPPQALATPQEMLESCPRRVTVAGRDELYSSRFGLTADHYKPVVQTSRLARSRRTFTIHRPRLGASHFEATAAWQTRSSPVQPGDYWLTIGAAIDCRASSSIRRRTASSRPAGSSESSARSMVAGCGP